MIPALLLVLALLGVAQPAFCQEGTIAGTIIDSSGAFVARARVTLSLDGRGPDRETQSTERGDFSFANVSPGPYNLSIDAAGFAVRSITGQLNAGEALTLPPITLGVAAFTAQVEVTPTEASIAEAQIHAEEHQRLLGVIPNFFVSYDPDAAPLTTGQKFELTWKGFVDVTAFAGTAIGAAIGQARNTNAGFGRGATGYAKRYAASYAEFATHRLIRRVVMTTVFKQDPRYFYKGTGTRRARAVYAISRSVICRGDNRHSQLCYSSLLSRFAAGAVTNLYLPAADRNDARTIVENGVLGIGGNAVGNLMQEFIGRKLTRRKH